MCPCKTIRNINIIPVTFSILTAEKISIIIHVPVIAWASFRNVSTMFLCGQCEWHFMAIGYFFLIYSAKNAL